MNSTFITLENVIEKLLHFYKCFFYIKMAPIYDCHG